MTSGQISLKARGPARGPLMVLSLVLGTRERRGCSSSSALPHILSSCSAASRALSWRDRLMEIGKWTSDTYPTLIRPYLVQALHGPVEPSLPPSPLRCSSINEAASTESMARAPSAYT